MARTDPPPTCRKCPRLVAFRRENCVRLPEFHNAPVQTWGALDAPLLIVGLAPGLRGANRTGRPFTGDASGELLFGSLLRAGLAVDEGGEIALRGCAITNAVACVPPENKPIGAEVAACRPYLAAKLRVGPQVLSGKVEAGFPSESATNKVVLVLGKLAHDAVLRALDAKVSAHSFSHGAVAEVAGITLVSSYHPSRYNVSTKRINAAMLDAAVEKGLAVLRG